jgi:uncharacterized membrane protein
VSTVLATLRPLRTELLGVAGVVLLWAFAAAAIVARLLSFGIPQACFADPSSDPACIALEIDMFRYQDLAGNWLTAVTYLGALLAAIGAFILGIATVAKELDQRTAVLAWSIGSSRRAWLLERTVPLLGFVVAIAIAVAQVIPALLRLRSPGSDLPTDFSLIPYLDFGPAALAVSVFGLTVMVGAMLGRVLPSLLAAGTLVVVAVMLVGQGNERLMAGESIVAETTAAGHGSQVDSLLRTPDGRIIGWDEAWPDYADPNTGQLRQGVTEMVRYIPIEIYPQAAARYALLHLLVGLAALTIAFAVVERRSP